MTQFNRIAWVIARKELREILRDKRTLVSLLLFPVLFYPAMLLLITQVGSVQVAKMEEQLPRVGIAPTVLLQVEDEFEVEKFEWKIGTWNSESISTGAVDALLKIDAEFQTQIEGTGTGTLTLVYDETLERSRRAQVALETALSAWQEAARGERLEKLGISLEQITPLEVVLQNEATPSQMGGYLLGEILPILLVMAIVLGAFYPAIDLTAGEKERKTLQTLLSAPITHGSILTGKFIAVAGITIASGFTNLGTIALLFGQSGIEDQLPEEIALSLSAGAILMVALSVLVLALFFAAVLMATATLARSFKEAQTYITPVYLSCLVPVLMSQLPGVHLGLGTAWVPGLNMTLALQSSLSGEGFSLPWFLALGCTLAYTAGALKLAALIFRNEAIRLGEQSGMGALRGNTRQRNALPWGEALILFGVLAVLVLYGGHGLQSISAPLGIFLTPILFLFVPTWAWSSFRGIRGWRALGVQPVRLPLIGGSFLLGLGSWAVVLPPVMWFNEAFLPFPEELAEKAQELLQGDWSLIEQIAMGLGITLGAGIAEELVFRGVLLRSFQSRFGDRSAVLLSAFLFAILHLSIHRLGGTFLLGLLAGWIVLKTGSLLPAMIFHAVHNGLVLGGGIILGENAASGEFPMEWLSIGWVLAGCGLALLYRYCRPLNLREEAESTVPPPPRQSTHRPK